MYNCFPLARNPLAKVELSGFYYLGAKFEQSLVTRWGLANKTINPVLSFVFGIPIDLYMVVLYLEGIYKTPHSHSCLFLAAGDNQKYKPDRISYPEIVPHQQSLLFLPVMA